MNATATAAKGMLHHTLPYNRCRDHGPEQATCKHDLHINACLLVVDKETSQEGIVPEKEQRSQSHENTITIHVWFLSITNRIKRGEDRTHSHAKTKSIHVWLLCQKRSGPHWNHQRYRKATVQPCKNGLHTCLVADDKNKRTKQRYPFARMASIHAWLLSTKKEQCQARNAAHMNGLRFACYRQLNVPREDCRRKNSSSVEATPTPTECP